MHSKLKIALTFTLALLVAVGVLWLAGGFEEENTLFALDVRNGRIAWSHAFPDAQNINDPIIVDDTIVLEVVTKAGDETYHHTVTALNATNGTKKWAYRSAPHIWSDYGTPVLYLQGFPDSHHLLIGSEQPHTADYHIQLLDTDSGKALWAFNSAFLGDGSWHDFSRNVPALNDAIFLISREDFDNVALQSRDISSGAVQWQTPLGIGSYELWQQTVTKPFMLTVGDSILHNIDNELFVYAAADGALQGTLPVAWFSKLGSTEDTLYICEDGLHKLAMPTQRELWHYDAIPFSNSWCEVSVTETAVFAIFAAPSADPDEHDSWLVTLDPATGTERWRTKLNATTGFFNSSFASQTPISAGEFVFALGGEWHDTDVMAFGVEDGRLHWTFPVRPGIDYAITNGDLIFVHDCSPRWRNWLAHLIPTWH